ncbi:hypothetical protein KCU91_g5600, partial [Aureobasidium melanogenum]
STFEHGRRGQIRRYLQKFTTTIRRGSKDSDVENNIPQSSVETNDAQEHSHDDTLFTNTIDADQLSTTRENPEEQSRPTPPVTTGTFHIDRASVYQERAQKLRDRYGMNIAGSDRSTFPATARRVQKSARMRIHRSCHECGVDFGHGIHCRACHHRLCGECPRTPGKGVKEAMAQAREFPFHVVAEESSTSPDLHMTEAPAVVSDYHDVFNTMSSTGKQVSKPSTSLEPILGGDSFLPTLEVDDNISDYAPIRTAYNFRHGKDKEDISISPRSSRHVPYPMSTIRDPILRAPSATHTASCWHHREVVTASSHSAQDDQSSRTDNIAVRPSPIHRHVSLIDSIADGLLGWQSSLDAQQVAFQSYDLDSKSYKEPVTLIVGATKEHYILHKDLLCFYSDFFRAAFNGSFKEAAERKIELPDTEVDVFEAFQVWLYTQKMPKNENTSSGKVHLEWPILIKLWIFGDKYQIPLLQNIVMDNSFDKVEMDAETPLYWIRLAYENTTPNSPLRKAITDIMAYRAIMHKSEATTRTCLSDTVYWPIQACLDVIAAMERGWVSNAPRKVLPTRDQCYYHVHATATCLQDNYTCVQGYRKDHAEKKD